MKIYTTRQVAELLGTDEWRVRRLFEDGDLAEPQKFGCKRIITEDMIPTIRQAMQARGWDIADHQPAEEVPA